LILFLKTFYFLILQKKMKKEHNIKNDKKKNLNKWQRITKTFFYNTNKESKSIKQEVFSEVS